MSNAHVHLRVHHLRWVHSYHIHKSNDIEHEISRSAGLAQAKKDMQVVAQIADGECQVVFTYSLDDICRGDECCWKDSSCASSNAAQARKDREYAGQLDIDFARIYPARDILKKLEETDCYFMYMDEV